MVTAAPSKKVKRIGTGISNAVITEAQAPTGAPAAQIDRGFFVMMPITGLVESHTNPRQVFHDLDDLTASVRQYGVLQPICVRPLGEKKFEIVAGARRFRAAQKAGLNDVPCIVRNLSDREAVEAQIIENDQRKDISPLDQAHAYKAAIDLGVPVAELASKTGRDESYIYKRLQLTKLIKPLQKMLGEEKLSYQCAMLLARYPETVQKDAVGDSWWISNFAFDVAEMRAALQDKYSFLLDAAPWKKDDVSLVAKAGACNSCSKRTGYNQALFDDVKRDTCLDAACYNAKKEAFIQLQISNVRANTGSNPVLIVDYSGEQKYKSMPHVLHYNADVLSAKEAKKVPLGEQIRAVVVHGEEAGRIVTIRKPSRASSDNAGKKQAAEQKARRERAAKVRAWQQRVHAAIVEKIRQGGLRDDGLRLIFKHEMARALSKDNALALGLVQPKKPQYGWQEEAANKLVDKLQGMALAAFVMSAMLLRFTDIPSYGEVRFNKDLAAAAELYAVDVDDLKDAEAQPETKAKPKAPAASTKGPATGFRVGDFVEVVGKRSENKGQVGIVVDADADGDFCDVRFSRDESEKPLVYMPHELEAATSEQAEAFDSKHAKPAQVTDTAAVIMGAFKTGDIVTVTAPDDTRAGKSGRIMDLRVGVAWVAFSIKDEKHKTAWAAYELNDVAKATLIEADTYEDPQPKNED